MTQKIGIRMLIFKWRASNMFSKRLDLSSEAQQSRLPKPHESLWNLLLRYFIFRYMAVIYIPQKWMLPFNLGIIWSKQEWGNMERHHDSSSRSHEVVINRCGHSRLPLKQPVRKHVSVLTVMDTDGHRSLPLTSSFESSIPAA